MYGFEIDLFYYVHRCHGAAVGRLDRLHDYPFWMFSFLCLN